MKRVVVCVVLLAGADAFAQAPLPYSETFDAGSVPAGWTVSSTSATVIWNVDALPSPVGDGLGGSGDPATFGGSAGSLNYNNDVSYEDGTGTVPFGTATSPTIDVTAAGGTVTITFQCNYETEDTGTTFDIRTMDVIDGTTSAVIASFLYAEFGDSNPPETTCATRGTYHSHTHVVATGAATSIQIRYSFDSGDGAVDDFDGWFIDSLSVSCGDTVPPSVPTPLLPADGSTVLSPPGVLLDWTDSTDTSACGPGTVANYVVEVDVTNPPVAPFTFTASPTVSNATTGVLAAGTYFWRVRAVDALGNTSADSVVFSFVVESPLPPGQPDTLHVNEDSDGAQVGEPGFVDPVRDLTPVFSAIYRDPNTTDSALQVRYQVSDDPSFATVVFDSGNVTIPALPKDTRSGDLGISVELDKDTLYFWRIQFIDAGGLVGAFSTAQSFRTGDDFEFGVRPGSSNHSRRCFVATASWNGVTPEVERLMQLRSGVLEASSAGRSFSRWYSGTGPSLGGAAALRPHGARVALAPLAAAAGHPGLAGFAAVVVLAALGIALIRRL